jgi:hypothetical protein
MTRGQNLITKVSVTVDASISEVWQALVFGAEDKPDNYHTVTIELSGAGDETKVMLTQDKTKMKKCANIPNKIGKWCWRILNGRS